MECKNCCLEELNALKWQLYFVNEPMLFSVILGNGINEDLFFKVCDEIEHAQHITDLDQKLKSIGIEESTVVILHAFMASGRFEDKCRNLLKGTW